MKKLKLFLAALICVLCICPAFAGCSTDNAEYIEDSFAYNVDDYLGALGKQPVDISFNLKIKKAGKYKVEYTLYGYDENDNNKWKQSYSKNVSCEVTDSYKVSSYISVSTTAGTKKVTIKDIKITEVKDEALYTDIALGLGISAAVLTVAVVTLFVLEKKGVIKSKKREE